MVLTDSDREADRLTHMQCTILKTVGLPPSLRRWYITRTRIAQLTQELRATAVRV